MMSGWTLSWFWTMDALGTDEMDGHYHGFGPWVHWKWMRSGCTLSWF